MLHAKHPCANHTSGFSPWPCKTSNHQFVVHNLFSLFCSKYLDRKKCENSSRSIIQQDIIIHRKIFFYYHLNIFLKDFFFSITSYSWVAGITWQDNNLFAKGYKAPSMDSNPLCQKEVENIGFGPMSQPTKTTKRFRETYSETLVIDTGALTLDCFTRDYINGIKLPRYLWRSQSSVGVYLLLKNTNSY